MGYHHFQRCAAIGCGPAVFTRAVEVLFGWDMHRRAGLRVRASTPAVREGTDVMVGLGPISAPCRVIYVVDEPHRRGFAYGTLSGHPEAGEEYFGVRIDPAGGVVYAEIKAFSRPALWWSKLGSKPAALVQRRITDRYVDALRTMSNTNG